MPGEVVEVKTGEEPIVLGAPTPSGEPPTPAAGAAEFDFSRPLPDNLPEELGSLKGKTFQDLIDSQKSLRGTLTERSDRIKALETENTALGKKVPKPGEEPAAEPLINADAFYAARDEYLESGEVAEGFLEAIARDGVRVDRDTALRFFEWQRFEANNMATVLSGHTQGKATVDQVKDCMTWLKSGESPFSPQEIKGFDSLYGRGNYSFFDTVLDEFGKTFGQAPYRREQFGGKRVSGRPVESVDAGAFKDSADFTAQMLAVRNDPATSPFEKRQNEKALIARRKKQHGE
jgi:hypothetical protein